MIRHLLALVLVLVAAPAAAAIDDGTLPSDTAWNVHLDLETMRATAVGQQIYGWLNSEVFDDVRNETGFDRDTELDTVALGNGNGPSSWNSGLLREAREVALVLADRGGEADLAVRVKANDSRTTDSLAAVVRGLIGLQALAKEQDPNVTRLLSSVQIDTDSAGMTLALRVAPDVLRAVIDN